MEDKELLKEITYWSQLINRSTAHREKPGFQSRYSKVNPVCKSVRIPPVERQTYHRNPSHGLPPLVTRYSCIRNNNTNSTSVSNQRIISPSKTVYVNKNMLSFASTNSHPNLTARTRETTVGKKCGVYFNPNFSVNRPVSTVPVKMPLETRVPEPVVKPKKEKTVLINPAFISKLNGNISGPCPPLALSNASKMSEKVYLNPKFLKDKNFPTPGAVESKSPVGNRIPVITNNSVIKQGPCDESKNKARSSKLIISKHKLVRRRSGSFNGLKSISLKNMKPTCSMISPKYKVNNRPKAKVKPESVNFQPVPTGKSDLLQRIGKNKEFQGSKYSIVRCRKGSECPGETSSLRNLKEASNRMRRSSLKSDSFKIVGRTKLVRKSVLQSQIIARRSLTNSRYKYMRNIINNDKKTFTPNFKTLKKTECAQAVQKKFPRSKTVFCSPKSDKRSIVNISGILYRSSRNKLTRRDIPKGSDSNGRIIHVGSVRFRLNRNGRTLSRLRKDSVNLNSTKVDLGRLTSVNPTNGQSVITNSRLRLKAAKQKSLAVLTAKLRKCNQPCLFFNRFGYCKRKQDSTCEKVHDPKLVAVCKDFLKGECSKEACLLSHSLAPEKMPICHHFLKGGCMREGCPYLHVKHNSKTPICLLFLDGYCPNASTCDKRHEYVCPAFSDSGFCPRGKRCTYPHPSRSKRADIKIKTGTPVFKEVQQSNEENESKPKEDAAVEVSNVRYFVSTQQLDGEKDSSVEDTSATADIILIEDSEDEIDVDSSLPQYIPLDQSVNE